MNRSVLPVLVVAALGVSACGGSDEPEATDAPEATTEVTEPGDDFTEDSVVEESTPEETTAQETTPPDTTPPETADPETTVAEAAPATDAPVDTEPSVGAPAGAAAVVLDEWFVEAPTEYAAGEITFTATNNGGFPHEFVVIQGESYEALPREEGGKVIEEDLPTGALLGRTDRLAGGTSADLTVTLQPGNYVLLCNLGSGGTSHAGQGQRLDVTVT